MKRLSYRKFGWMWGNMKDPNHWWQFRVLHLVLWNPFTHVPFGYRKSGYLRVIKLPGIRIMLLLNRKETKNEKEAL